MISDYLKNYKVLLASGSNRRHELLKGLEINFKIITHNIKESYPNKLKGSQITDFISKKKSLLLLNDLKKNELLITSDTIVWFNDKAIEKPKNRQEAREMLAKLSGEKHQVFTSICISLKNQQKIVNQETKVYFNILKKEDINYYVKKYDVLDRAGSYGIQDLIGYIGVKKIEGCYNNVLGFPTSLFCETIEKMKL